MNILIIDDDQFTRKLLSHQLLEQGFAISSAENGEQALKLLETNKEVDVILLDLVMPHLSGPSFLIKLKHYFKGKKPKIIIITGLHNGTDFLHKMGTEYDFLFEKPIDFARLKNTLTEIKASLDNTNTTK
jgi:DNA-binding response OmpR family regulator